MGAMTEAEANAVYDVLVRECGAQEGESWSSRVLFIRAHVSASRPSKWSLVFSSDLEIVFHSRCGDEPHRVCIYPEDETPKRRAMVERANAALKKLTEDR